MQLEGISLKSSVLPKAGRGASLSKTDPINQLFGTGRLPQSTRNYLQIYDISQVEGKIKYFEDLGFSKHLLSKYFERIEKNETLFSNLIETIKVSPDHHKSTIQFCVEAVLNLTSFGTAENTKTLLEYLCRGKDKGFEPNDLLKNMLYIKDFIRTQSGFNYIMELAGRFLDNEISPTFGLSLRALFRTKPHVKALKEVGELIFEVAYEFKEYKIPAEIMPLFWTNNLYSIFWAAPRREYKNAVSRLLRLALFARQRGVNLQEFLKEYALLLSTKKEEPNIGITPKQYEVIDELLYNWLEAERPYAGIIQGLKLIVEYGIGDSPIRIKKFGEIFENLYKQASVFSLETFFESFSLYGLRKCIKSIDDIGKLIEAAQKFDSLQINQRVFLQSLSVFKDRINSEGLERTADGLYLLAFTCAKTRDINFKYLMENLSAEAAEVMTFEDINQLLQAGFYPTDYIASKYKELPTEERTAYIKKLSEKMVKINTTEEIDLEDQESIELYHRYLGVNIDILEFKRILKEYGNIKFGQVKPFFKPFAVSANGLEVVTSKVNLQAIEELAGNLKTFNLESIMGKLFSRQIPLSPENFTRFLFSICRIFLRMEDLKNLRERITVKNVLFHSAAMLANENDPLRFLTLIHCLPVLIEIIKTNKKLENDKDRANCFKGIIFKNRADAEDLYEKSKEAILAMGESLLNGILAKSTLSFPTHLLETLIYYQQSMEYMRQFEENTELNKRIQAQQKLLQTALQQLLPPYVDLKIKSPEIKREVLERTINILERESLLNPKIRELLLPFYEHYALEVSPDLTQDLNLEDITIKIGALSGLYKELIIGLKEKTLNGLIDYVRITLTEQLSQFVTKLKQDAVKKGINLVFGKLKALKGNKEIKFDEDNLAKIKSLQERISVLQSHNFESEISSISTLLNAVLDSINSDFAKRLQKDLSTEMDLLLNQLDKIAAIGDLVHSLLERINQQKTIPGLLDLINNTILDHKKKLASLLENEELINLKKKIDGLNKQKEEKIKNVPAGENQKAQQKEINRKYRDLLTPLESQAAKLTHHSSFLSSLNVFLSDFQGRIALADQNLQNKINLIESELAKIEKHTLAENVYYLVPSHGPGDIFKGWVSEDCTTGYLDQFLNEDFTNYRIYQRENGGRKWVGNAYILEAYHNGDRVLVIDVIQPQKHLKINHEQFVQGVVDGFKGMLSEGNFDYLIMNNLQSLSDGTVSNRREIREACFKLFQDNKETISPGKVVMRDKRAHFQSIADGRFKILWKHPDLQSMESGLFLSKVVEVHGNSETISALSDWNMGKYWNKRKLNFFLGISTKSLEILIRNLGGQENIDNLLFNREFLSVLERIEGILETKSSESKQMTDSLVASMPKVLGRGIINIIASLKDLAEKIASEEFHKIKNYAWPYALQGEYKKAELLLNFNGEDINRFMALLDQFKDSELGEAETIASLESKIFEKIFKDSGLTAVQSLQNVFISGKDIMFYMSGNEKFLRFFSPPNLSGLKRAHKGLDPEKYESRAREEDEYYEYEEEDSQSKQEFGYRDLHDFIEDQRNIINEKGHQQPCGEPGGFGSGMPLGLHQTFFGLEMRMCQSLSLRQEMRLEQRLTLELKQMLVDQMEMRLVAIDDPSKVKFFRIAGDNGRTIKIVSKKLGDAGSNGVYREVQNILDLKDKNIPGVELPKIFGIAESDGKSYLLLHHVPYAVTLVDLIQRKKAFSELFKENKTRFNQQELEFLVQGNNEEELININLEFLRNQSKKKARKKQESEYESENIIHINGLIFCTEDQADPLCLPKRILNQYIDLKAAQLALQLGALAARMHKAGIEYNGIAPRNIMVRFGENVEFILVDHENTNIYDKPLSSEQRKANLSRFEEEMSLFLDNETLRKAFLRGYFKELRGQFNPSLLPHKTADLRDIYGEEKEKGKEELTLNQRSLLDRIIDELKKDPDAYEKEIGERLGINECTISRALSTEESKQRIAQLKASGVLPKTTIEKMNDFIVELLNNNPKMSNFDLAKHLDKKGFRHYSIRGVRKLRLKLERSGRLGEDLKTKKSQKRKAATSVSLNQKHRIEEIIFEMVYENPKVNHREIALAVKEKERIDLHYSTIGEWRHNLKSSGWLDKKIADRKEKEGKEAARLVETLKKEKAAKTKEKSKATRSAKGKIEELIVELASDNPEISSSQLSRILIARGYQITDTTVSKWRLKLESSGKLAVRPLKARPKEVPQKAVIRKRPEIERGEIEKIIVEMIHIKPQISLSKISSFLSNHGYNVSLNKISRYLKKLRESGRLKCMLDALKKRDQIEIERIIVEAVSKNPDINSSDLAVILSSRGFEIARQSVSIIRKKLIESGKLDEIQRSLKSLGTGASMFLSPVIDRDCLPENLAAPVLDKIAPELKRKYLLQPARVRHTPATHKLFSVLLENDSIYEYNLTQPYYSSFKEKTGRLGIPDNFDSPGKEYPFSLKEQKEAFVADEKLSNLLVREITQLHQKQQNSKLEIPALIELLENQRKELIDKLADGEAINTEDYLDNLLLLVTNTSRSWNEIIKAFANRDQLICLLKLEELFRDNLINEIVNKEENALLRQILEKIILNRFGEVSGLTKQAVQKIESLEEAGRDVNYKLVLSSKDTNELLRGEVSSDCTALNQDFAFHETVPQHFFDPGFLSFRLYENDEWAGNVYLLVEEIEGEPILIIDAIQFSTTHGFQAPGKVILDKIIEKIQQYALENDFQGLYLSKFISNRASIFYWLDEKYPLKIIEAEKVGGFNHLKELGLWSDYNWRNEYLETNSPGNPNAEKQTLPLRKIWGAAVELTIVAVDPQEMLKRSELALSALSKESKQEPAALGQLPSIKRTADQLLNNPRLNEEQNVFLNFAYESLKEARGLDDEEVRDALHYVYTKMNEASGFIPQGFVLGIENVNSKQIIEIQAEKRGNIWYRELKEPVQR